jgi:hypothetical protein
MCIFKKLDYCNRHINTNVIFCLFEQQLELAMHPHTHTHTSLILFPPQSFPAAGTIIDLTNLSAPKTGKVLKRYILFRLRRLAIASSSSTTPHSSWREETRRQEYIQIPTFTIELGDFDFLFCACTIVIAR